LANSRLVAQQRGAVMVEMALTLGIFMVILLALFEFSLLMFTWSRAVEATRLGSRLAVVSTPVTSLEALDCEAVSRVETTCASASCGALETRMRGLLPQLNAGQIHISYSCAAVGYAAGPAAFRVYDVTVSIEDFRTTLVMPGLLGFPLEMTMPDFSTTRTSEDLHTP
jgi:Flp pilus assembly protein TadG